MLQGQPVLVPDETGQDPTAAAAALTKLGLVPSVDATTVGSDQPAGKVASTDPAAGTIVMQAGSANSVTAKPVVANGDLNLQVLDVKGVLTKDTVQKALDDLTKKLNDNYPLGIHADSVKVTSAGVVGTFSSQDAKIPTGESNPCFARL